MDYKKGFWAFLSAGFSVLVLILLYKKTLKPDMPHWPLTFLLCGIILVVFLFSLWRHHRLNKEMLFWKQDAKRRQHAETLFGKVFDLNPIQTIIVDKDAKIMMHNFAGKKTHGSLPAIGDVLYKDYASKHKVNMYEALMICIQNNEHREFSEIKYKERYLNIHIAPFSHGAIVTLIDVTQRRLLADELHQARKMEAIGTLAGGVAHDFNNILSIILGNMELALDEVPRWSAARNNLKEIQTAGLRARDVVGQLLSFSRKTHISKVAVDLQKIVHESENLLRSSFPSSIEIVTKIPQDIFSIKADATQIQQIVINLCTNANHAMEDMAMGTLIISLENVVLDEMSVTGFGTMAPGKYVMLQVIDTGHGIDPLTQKKLFDPYFTTKGVGKGTGMGLFVVQGIVKNHEGAVQVDSLPGHGTTVSVFFPATDENLPEKKGPIAPPSKGTETLLVVDDEEALVNIARSMLTPLGYQVKGTTFPHEALALFQTDPMAIDLVITDMTMPLMSGEDLARRMTSIRPQVPIVLCTGLARKITPEQLREMGMVKCIEKPLDRGILSSTVRQVLDRTAG